MSTLVESQEFDIEDNNDYIIQKYNESKNHKDNNNKNMEMTSSTMESNAMALDFSNLKSNGQPSIKDYQKLRVVGWPPIEVIDKSFTCVLCNLQSSPRSTTPVISKVKFIDRNTGQPVTPRTAKRFVEYCCNDCVGGIKSVTSSPRTSMEFTPSAPSSPRSTQVEAQKNRVERRRSIDHRGATVMIRSSESYSPRRSEPIAIPYTTENIDTLVNRNPLKKTVAENIDTLVSRNPLKKTESNTDTIRASPARPSNLSRSKTASDLNAFASSSSNNKDEDIHN